MDWGYIKIWRKVKDTSFYTDSHAVHIFLDLLIGATWKIRKVWIGQQEITLNPGDVLCSQEAMAKRLGIPRTTFRRKLKFMETCGIVAIKSATKFSVVSIINWSTYQSGEDENMRQDGQQMATKWPTDGHIQEVKEVKALKKEPNITAKEEFVLPEWIPKTEWDAWMDMRKKKKIPTTERALVIAVNKLEKLKKEGQEIGKVLDQSTFAGYPGLYPVKKENSPATSSSYLFRGDNR